MKDIINVAVNNGLVIFSFIALLYFIYKYIGELNSTLKKINDSMIEIQVALVKLTERVTDIEKER